MSFIGAVSASVRKVLAEYARNVVLPPLIVGAGNFTVPFRAALRGLCRTHYGL